MYRRILIPLDGSAFAESTLPLAISLGTRWGAALELTTVANVPLSGVSDFPQEDALERMKKYAGEYLAAVEARIRNAGFDGEIRTKIIPAGNVPRSLVRHSVEREVDFAVITTHGRGPIGRAWLGSTADGFVRRSPIPVLLVRPDEGGPEPELAPAKAPFRRVLVPLDGSEASERALEKARPLAADDGAELVLVRVVHDPSFPGESPYLPHVIREEKEHQEVQAGAHRYLERVASEVSDVAAVRTRVITAPRAATAVLEAIEEEKADLVALATAGRGGAARLLLGSVADKVVRGSPVPVLVFRAPEPA